MLSGAGVRGMVLGLGSDRGVHLELLAAYGRRGSKGRVRCAPSLVANCALDLGKREYGCGVCGQAVREASPGISLTGWPEMSFRQESGGLSAPREN